MSLISVCFCFQIEAQVNPVFDSVFTEIPNVFTPNKDGINDDWVVKNLPAGTKVQVLDRWGNEQIRAENVTGFFIWDGHNSADVACVDGVYYYIIITPVEVFKGFLQLLH